MLHLLTDEYRGKIQGLRIGGTMCDFGEMQCQTMNGHNVNERFESAANHDSDIAQLQTEITTNQSNINTNSGSIATHGSDITQLQSDVSSNQANINTNSGSIATQGSDITQLQSDILSTQVNVTTNSGSIATQGSNITQLQSDVSSNQANINTNSGSIATQGSDITQLQSDVSSTLANVSTNSGSIATQGSNITQLQSDVSSNQASLSSKLERVATTSLNMNNHDLIGIDGLSVSGDFGTAIVGGSSLHWKQLRLIHPNSTVSKWDIGAQYPTPSTSDNDLYFSVTYSNGAQHSAGFIQDNSQNVQMNATIQHRCFYMGVYDDSMVGKIVISSGRYMNMLKQGEICSQKRCISINDSIPIVELCNSPASNAVFGVVSDREEDKRVWAAGNFVSTYDKAQGDTRLIVNGGGEGAIWICNQGGNLQIGDLIESYGDGFGRKQSDNIVRSSSVARITMSCDFNPVSEPIKIYTGFDEDTKTIIWEYPTDDQGNPITEPMYECKPNNIGGVNCMTAFVGCVYLAS